MINRFCIKGTDKVVTNQINHSLTIKKYPHIRKIIFTIVKLNVEQYSFQYESRAIE